MYQGYTYHEQHILHVRDVVPEDKPEPRAYVVGDYYVVCDTCTFPAVIGDAAVFAARNNIRQLVVDGVLLNRTYRK